METIWLNERMDTYAQIYNTRYYLDAIAWFQIELQKVLMCSQITDDEKLYLIDGIKKVLVKLNGG